MPPPWNAIMADPRHRMAIDHDDHIYILQSRPLKIMEVEREAMKSLCGLRI